MLRILFRTTLWILSISASILLAGCKPIQITVKSTKEPLWRPVQDLVELPPGGSVKLRMLDGKVTKTKYNSSFLRPSSQYSKAYHDWLERQSLESRFPDFGSAVSVDTSGGEPLVGIFDGLDLDRLYLRSGETTQAVKFSDVAFLMSSSGSRVTGEQLKGRVIDDRAPLRRGYWFGEEDQRVEIDPREIQDFAGHGPLVRSNDAAAAGGIAALVAFTYFVLPWWIWY